MIMVSLHSRSDDFFQSRETLHLPEELRDELKVPLGRVVKEAQLSAILENAGKIVTVGDMCSLTLFEMGIVPDIAVVDFKTRRGEVGDKRPEILKIGQIVINVKSPAGDLTRELWDAVSRAYEASAPVRIEVDGEEDLAALPCIWLAPLGTTVVYGLPDIGLVVVDNDSARIKVKDVLSKMK
jgi:uncharacterized protein (UPF0218 family)